jgi:hypothetical protein
MADELTSRDEAAAIELPKYLCNAEGLSESNVRR